jgi:hypothetical protein
MDEDFPTKNKKKAERRDKKRSKLKRVLTEINPKTEHYIQWICQNVDNLKACDCVLCRNPRKSFRGKRKIELTIQERKQDE